MAESEDDRITDLEIKLAFMERALEGLDGVVQQLALELGRNRKALKELEEKVAAGAVDNDMDAEAALLYEKPPHY